MILDYLLVFLAIFFVPWVIIFLIIFFMPVVTTALHPWICKNRPGNFRYRDSLISYINWAYRISSYSCRMKTDRFFRGWAKASAVYATGMSLTILLMVLVGGSINSEICVFGFLIILLIADIILRAYIERFVEYTPSALVDDDDDE